MYFHYFFLYFPLEKVISFIYTNLDLRHVPSLIVIGPMVMLKKIFLIFNIVFSLIRNYLTLKKGVSLHLNKSHKNALCQVWLKLTGGTGKKF